MKTLIINGSPRVSGDNAALIRELRQHLHGEVTELSAYRANISPCVDCRGCFKTRGCVIEDDLRVIFDDDFDGVVLASPVYFADLPGPVRSLLSRFQWQRGSESLPGESPPLRPKKAGLILTAGGSGNESGALRPARVLFKLMNASGFEEHTIMSANTDTLPASGDAAALDGVRELAAWLNE
jgi:multimeric flavodoxin WrbA